jgi:DGQHR domain-containing protein
MNGDPLRLQVLRVSQPIGDFYIASIDARDLVGIAYSDVRRLVEERRDVEKYLGIQRAISVSRIKQIKKYIAGPDSTFPTAVLVAVDERCAEYEASGEDRCGTLTLRPYEPEEDSEDSPIPVERIAKVIDGQHRIGAFIDDNGKYVLPGPHDKFEINLAIFVGADVSEQANVFATVNLAQTRVNKSLVYDLTDLAESRSPHKTCHNIAVVLDSERSSPLYKRIKRLGTATPGRKYEPLTQAAFVEALVKFISLDPVQDRNDILEGKQLRRASTDELSKTPFRNLFIDEADVDIVQILFNYFLAVKKKWPNSWSASKESGNLLPRSNAFAALMKFLRDDVYPELAGQDFGRIPKVKEFSPYFDPIRVTDADFNSRNFVPGSGGQSTFLRMLRREIDADDMFE